MQDRPTARELLAAIADLLDHEVVPALQGPVQHQARVAGNLARILERELAVGPEQEAREASLLRELLDDPAGDVAADSAALAARLRVDRSEAFQRRAHAVLLEVVRGKLAIAKPGHDAYDFGPEVDR